jgi:hypothetical protein
MAEPEFNVGDTLVSFNEGWTREVLEIQTYIKYKLGPATFKDGPSGVGVTLTQEYVQREYTKQIPNFEQGAQYKSIFDDITVYTAVYVDDDVALLKYSTATGTPAGFRVYAREISDFVKEED